MVVACLTEVAEFEGVVVVDEEIFRLDVPVHHIVIMTPFYCFH